MSRLFTHGSNRVCHWTLVWTKAWPQTRLHPAKGILSPALHKTDPCLAPRFGCFKNRNSESPRASIPYRGLCLPGVKFSQAQVPGVRSRPGRWRPDSRGADAGAGAGPGDEDGCQDGSGSGRTPTFPSTRPPAREPRPRHPTDRNPSTQAWAAVTEQLAPKFVHLLLPPGAWVPSASPLLLQSALLSADSIISCTWRRPRCSPRAVWTLCASGWKEGLPQLKTRIYIYD